VVLQFLEVGMITVYMMSEIWKNMVQPYFSVMQMVHEVFISEVVLITMLLLDEIMLYQVRTHEYILYGFEIQDSLIKNI